METDAFPEPSDIGDEETAYMVLDTADHPLLMAPSEELFDKIKVFMTRCRYLLWVSTYETDSANVIATKALATGLARVARRENEDVRFITLDIQQPLTASTVSQVSKAIIDVAETCLWPKSRAQSSAEMEYAFDSGTMLVPRLEPDRPFNSWIDRVNGKASMEACQYQNLDNPLKLEVETPGLLTSLRFVHDDKPSKPLGPGEIRLESHAYGVNFRDVFIALGQMLPGLPMVGEVAGVVTAVGSDLHSEYKVGDRVMAVGAEPFSNHGVVKGLRGRVLPDNVSFTEAASIPIVFLTAYHCLVEVARLEKGQTVLIHAASGGVGQAAVQIAKHIGAEIFATVGSTEKRQLIVDRYGIPESHIFSSRKSSFKRGVMRLTEGKGCDVILNSLAGEMLVDSWECIAHLGTFVEIGKADIYKKSQLSMVPFDKSTTFAAIDLLALFDRQPRKMYAELGKIVELLGQGVLRAVYPLMTMPINEIEASFRLIATRKHIGKVIVEADRSTMVQSLRPPPAELKLDRLGSYLVAGGLGDLGKRFCRQLAKHGAGHVVTLSRRTLDDDFRKSFEDEIAALGGKLHVVKCDITDKASVDAAAAYCKATLPPVKGIIQGGMVLRVRTTTLFIFYCECHTNTSPGSASRANADQ